MFQAADDLVLEVYRVSATFPSAERYGLQSQLRRAAVSAAANIVEACARRSEGEYVQLLSVATASAAEAQYLVSLSQRLGFLPETPSSQLGNRYTELLKGLQKLVTSLAGPPARS